MVHGSVIFWEPFLKFFGNYFWCFLGIIFGFLGGSLWPFIGIMFGDLLGLIFAI